MWTTVFEIAESISTLLVKGVDTKRLGKGRVNPILPWGGGKIRPLLFFLHHPKTAKGINLKLSDFRDTHLRHLVQVKPVRYILSCSHGNKITKGARSEYFFWGVASRVPSLQATLPPSLPPDIFGNFRYELSHPLPVLQKY